MKGARVHRIERQGPGAGASLGASLDMSRGHGSDFRGVPLLVLAAEISFVALLGVALPVLALASRRRFDEGRVPRGRALFIQVFVQLVVIGLIATAVAAITSMPAFVPPRLDVATIGGALAFLLIAAGSLPLRWRRASAEDRRRLGRLLPREREDAVPWILLCLAAGWAEELAYRGVLTGILERWSGSLVVASVISAIAFAAAHAVQGRKAALVVFGFALAFQALCEISGSLVPAMIVHAAYDLVAGALSARLAAREPREATEDASTNAAG